LWLPGFVLPSSPIVAILGHCCLFGQVCLLWVTWKMVYMILESKLLLSILDGEADLGTVHVDDGFCGA
jgi:hypothetical protein